MDLACVITRKMIIVLVDLQYVYNVNGLGEYIQPFLNGLEEYEEVKRDVWNNKGTKSDKFDGVLKRFSTTDDPLKSGEWRLLMKTGYSSLHGDCICSQHLYNRFFYYNEKNQKIIVVGSECIKKFGSRGDALKCKLIISLTTQTSNKKFPCGNCGKRAIKNLDKSIFCYGCKEEPSKMMIELLGYNRCIKCEKDVFRLWNIEGTCFDCRKEDRKREITERKRIRDETLKLNDEPQLVETEMNKSEISLEIKKVKTKKIDSMSNKNVSEIRQCTGCGDDLPEGSPKWKKECLDCYKASKMIPTQKADGKTCVTCKAALPEDNPSWKKECLNCFSSKNPKKITPKIVRNGVPKCEKCKEDMPEDTPSWKKVCIDCYKSNNKPRFF